MKLVTHHDYVFFSIILIFVITSGTYLYDANGLLTTKDGKTSIIDSDFPKGLIVINPEKGIFKTNEKIVVDAAVLDNQGHPSCDSNVIIKITNYDNPNNVYYTKRYDTLNCQVEHVDFPPLSQGNYSITATASSKTIHANFTNMFEVSDHQQFEISRKADTSVDPLTNQNMFIMKIPIKFNATQDKVKIQESVPNEFKIVTDGKIEHLGDKTILIWDKKLLENKTFVQYSYSIPLKFPKLYSIGPLKLTYGNQTFVENKPWFIAADPRPQINSTTTGASSSTSAFSTLVQPQKVASFKISSGSNMVLIVPISISFTSSSHPAPSSVTWGGSGSGNCASGSQSLTDSGITSTNQTGAIGRTLIYYLKNPNTGTCDISVNYNGTLGGAANPGAVIGAIVLNNTSSNPIGHSLTNSTLHITNYISDKIVNGSSSLILQVFETKSVTTVAPTIGSSQTQLWNNKIGTILVGGASTKNGGTSGTSNWTYASGTFFSVSSMAEVVSDDPRLTESLAMTDSITVIAPNAASTHGADVCIDCTPPVLSGPPFSTSEHGIVIGDTAFDVSKPVTTTTNVGSPVRVKLLIFDQYGPTAVQHVTLFTNLNGQYRKVKDSDTVISWDASSPLQISDPHKFFSNVDVSTTPVGNKLQVTFDITFAKPMNTSDIIIRTWNSQLASSDTYALDAWNSTGPSQSPYNSTLIPHANTPPDVLEAIKEWSANSLTMTDSKLLDDMGLHGNHIPSWVKKTTKWIVSGDISLQEFDESINYMYGKNIIK